MKFKDPEKVTLTLQDVVEAMDRVRRANSFPYEGGFAFEALSKELSICPHDGSYLNAGLCIDCGHITPGEYI